MSEVRSGFPTEAGRADLGHVLRPLRPFIPWLTLLALLYLVFSILGLVAQQLWSPTVAGTVGFLAYPVTIGVFIVGGLYFHHAGQNADQLGAHDRTWAPYWGFVSWVIPVANVLLPWFYVSEVWKASHPQAGERDWRDQRVPAWMVLWWAAWGGAVALGVVGTVAGTAIGISTGLEAVRQGTAPATDVALPTWLIAMQWSRLVLMAVALPFFIRLIHALADRQRARAQRLLALQQKAHADAPTGTF